jgi:hypothetical protein
MNTSTNTNKNHNAPKPARNGRFQRHGMAAAVLATAISASAVGLAATGYADSAQLQSLIPTPASAQRTDGPANISDNGIRMHFMVNGPATSVMDAYKAALEGAGWTVTVANSGGWSGAGGATYTGTRGGNYGVFTGGGSGGATDINACAWPSKPANSNCGNRR